MAKNKVCNGNSIGKHELVRRLELIAEVMGLDPATAYKNMHDHSIEKWGGEKAGRAVKKWWTEGTTISNDYLPRVISYFAHALKKHLTDVTEESFKNAFLGDSDTLNDFLGVDKIFYFGHHYLQYAKKNADNVSILLKNLYGTWTIFRATENSETLVAEQFVVERSSNDMNVKCTICTYPNGDKYSGTLYPLLGQNNAMAILGGETSKGEFKSRTLFIDVDTEQGSEYAIVSSGFSVNGHSPYASCGFMSKNMAVASIEKKPVLIDASHDYHGIVSQATLSSDQPPAHFEQRLVMTSNAHVWPKLSGSRAEEEN